MSAIGRVPAWRRYLTFWRDDVARDVEDELRFHAEMRVDEYVARGMTADEARRTVAERLGDVDAARAACVALGRVRVTHARNADLLDGVRHDLRYALRSLGRTPGWTAVALLTIALGVGATTAVFRVADALLVRPLHYRDASRVYVARRRLRESPLPISAPILAGALRDWRAHARSVEAAEPFLNRGAVLGILPDTIGTRGVLVDEGFLGFVGARPVLGRGFTAGDRTADEPTVMMLGEDFWRRQFGAARDVVGTTVRWDGRPVTIVGVMPAAVQLPEFRGGKVDVWLPLPIVADTDMLPGVIVRLRPGVSRAAAEAELAAMYGRSQSPQDRPWWRDLRPTLRLSRPQEELEFRRTLTMLAGAVALLLLVACTNVAHLLLARGAARRRELAVRFALGAGRPRLVRQLVTESMVVAVLGGALAALVGWLGLRLLQAARPDTLVALSFVPIDRGVVATAGALAVVVGLAIGLVSALRSAQRDPGLALRAAHAGTALAGRRLRSLLVVGEVALSATLLVGALLLIHAVYDLETRQLGFDAGRLYAVSFQRASPDTPLPAELAGQVRARAATIPGVERFTIASLPMTQTGFVALSQFETPERGTVQPVAEGAAIGVVEPDFFRVMGMSLLAGRLFDAGSAERHEVIVNRTLARLVAPDGEAAHALGHRFRNGRPIPGPKPWLTVIGVVPDIVSDLLASTPQLQLYQPRDSSGASGSMTLLLRLRGGDDGATAVERFARAMQPTQARIDVRSVRERIDRTAAEPRFTMRVLVVFASLGVVLAAVGLFGVISYSVGQRTREIGVRMTFGATRGAIARLVVGDGVRLALAGIAIGLAASALTTRVLQSQLHGLSRLDPLSFAVGAALLLLVAVAACVVPMLRATAVDPAIAVRAD